MSKQNVSKYLKILTVIVVLVGFFYYALCIAQGAISVLVDTVDNYNGILTNNAIREATNAIVVIGVIDFTVFMISMIINYSLYLYRHSNMIYIFAAIESVAACILTVFFDNSFGFVGGVLYFIAPLTGILMSLILSVEVGTETKITKPKKTNK